MCSSGFQLIPCADEKAMSRTAGAMVLDVLREKPNALFVLPTGATPERLYAWLAHERTRRPELFAGIRVAQLDEWIGGGSGGSGSCLRYLREKVLTPLDISPDRFFGFDPDTLDPDADCRRMEGILAREAPIDLCVLGLGLSGHVGFNEPGCDAAAGPHVAVLAPETLRHPMAAGADPARLRGVTLGLRDILSARRILFLVAGDGKEEVFRRCVRGAISTACPASLLRRHRAVDVLYDASRLRP